MNDYDDPIARAIEQRMERRRRFLHETRGWLRAERAPRLTVLGMLIVCAVAGAAFDLWLQHTGFAFRPYRWMIAAFSTWPLFLALLRWRAGVEASRLGLVEKTRHFVVHDEAAEEQEANPQPGKWQKAFNNAWDQEGQRAFSREMGRATGGGGVFVIIILLVVSMGTWLAWDLIRLGPTLLAETMIDGVLVPAEPRLALHMDSDRWLKNLAPSTGFHFMGLAFAGLMLGIFLPPDSLWQR